MNAAECGIQFSEQGLNMGPLHWEEEVLATRPQGSPWTSSFFNVALSLGGELICLFSQQS